MITQLLSAVTNLIIQIISTLGYTGVFLLMSVQTVAIPVPSEVILPFAGFLVFTGRFNLFFIALIGGLGSCLGSSIAYWIGYKGGRPLVEKYGKAILFSEHDLQLTEKFFGRFGTWAGFFGMLLPVVRSFVSFPAGVAKVPLKKYLAFVFAGSFIWSLLLAYIGMKLGEHWVDLHSRFQKFDVVIVALIVLGIVWWVWRHIKNRKVGQ